MTESAVLLNLAIGFAATGRNGLLVIERNRVLSQELTQAIHVLAFCWVPEDECYALCDADQWITINLGKYVSNKTKKYEDYQE